MPTKNTQKNSAKQPKSQVKGWRQTALITGVVIAGVFLLWFVTRNTSVYDPNRVTLRAEIEKLLNLPSQDKEVYSQLVDEGCDTGNSVGLSKRINCRFLGQKFYIGRDSLTESLHALDAKLIGAGWHRNLNGDKPEEEFEKVLNGEDDSWASYKKDTYSRTSVHISFYKANEDNNDYALEKLIKSNRIAAPKSKEYIYGLGVQAIYWACREDKIYQQPCSEPQ